MASTILISNLTITQPRTSPGVNLAAAGGTWTATLDIVSHAGSGIYFTIQSSATNGSNTWSDVSNNSLIGADGVGKFGQDISHQVLTFGLYGTGPWWRVNVTDVAGSVLVNSLSVSNA